jgi:hypothetical protein
MLLYSFLGNLRLLALLQLFIMYGVLAHEPFSVFEHVQVIFGQTVGSMYVSS